MNKEGKFVESCSRPCFVYSHCVSRLFTGAEKTLANDKLMHPRS